MKEYVYTGLALKQEEPHVMQSCAIGQIISQKKHFHTFICETTYLGPKDEVGNGQMFKLRDSFNKLVIYTYNLSMHSLFSEIILRTTHHNLLAAIIVGSSKCKQVILCLIIRGCELTYAFCIYNSNTRANGKYV